MIYLDNTTSPQTVLVPLAADNGADLSRASVTLVSTVGLSSPELSGVNVSRAGTAGGWLAVTLSLPADAAPGSYEYRVEAGGKTLSSGCAQLGVYDAGTKQYEKNIIYKQYERK